jgi:hypothetical protein
MKILLVQWSGTEKRAWIRNSVFSGASFLISLATSSGSSVSLYLLFAWMYFSEGVELILISSIFLPLLSQPHNLTLRPAALLFLLMTGNHAEQLHWLLGGHNSASPSAQPDIVLLTLCF